MSEKTGVRTSLPLPEGFLTRLRSSAEMTQSDLAVDSGVSVRTIGRSESSNSVTADIAVSLGLAYTTHFGFSIDLRNSKQVAHLDSLLKRNQQLTPDTAGTPWPEYISNDLTPDRPVVGRSELISEIFTEINVRKRTDKKPIILLRGKPGVGKTTIARQFASDLSHHFYGVWWCRAQSLSDLIGDFCRLGDIIGLHSWNYDSPYDRALAVVDKIAREGRPWLVVFDNAESPRVVSSFVPDKGNVSVIATTREGEWPTERYSEFEVNVLEPISAKLLFEQEAGRAQSAANEVYDLVTEHLDGLPLAIVHAGAWFKDSPSATVAQYVSQLSRRISFKPETIYDYPDSLYGAVMLSVEKLTTEARTVAQVLAFWAPTNLSPRFFDNLKEGTHTNELFAPLPLPIRNINFEASSISGYFAELRRRGLLDFSGESYSMHRVNQLVVRASIHKDEYKIAGQTAASILCTYYPPSEEVYSNPNRLSDLAEHNRVSLQYVCPSAEAAKLRILGWYHHDFQRNDDLALEYANSAVELNDQFRGEDNFDFGMSYNNLGITLWRMGDIQGAKAATSKSAEMARSATVKCVDHGIWTSVHGIILMTASDELASGQRQTALVDVGRMHQRALAIFNKVFNTKTNRFTGTCLTHLANLRALQGRWEASLRLYSMSLQIRELVLEPNDPDIAYSYVNTGMALLESGRGAIGHKGLNAIRYLLKGLRVREQAFADRPRHPERVSAARWLLRAYLVLPESSKVPCSPPDNEIIGALSREYQLDISEAQRSATQFVERMRQFENGKFVPPMPSSES